MKKTLLLILLGALLLGGGWYGFKIKTSLSKHQRHYSPEEYEATFAKVERETIIDKVVVSGDISPDSRNSVEVKGEISGKIKKIYPVIGQSVKSGDTLIELDDRDLLTEKSTAQTDVEGAQLSLDKAKRLFERSEKLFQKKLISIEESENKKTDFLIAQNNFEKSESRLRSVIDKLDKTQIRSPINGKVIALPVVAGQVVVGAGSVNAGTLLMTVADLSKMIISCHINQIDIAHINENQAVTFKVDSVRQELFKGTVSIISPTASSKNNIKGYGVTIQILELDPKIRPGMTADVTFLIKTSENALTLPLSAIFNDENEEKVVYLKPKPEMEPKKQTISTGIVTFDRVEILSGLQEGDEVLLTKPKSSRK